MNTDAPWPSLIEAESRVLEIQTKLHRWAMNEPTRRFDDLHNLVCDPAFLTVAWSRVRGNKGARTAGVDGLKPRDIVFGEAFLWRLRENLKARRFVPRPVREKLIPKKNGKLRGLGIPTARDRIVQGALKLVLEPIFEADFKPCSYGFRPGRRAHDAIAEIRHLTTGSRNYEWVLEGDIKACFDEIDHTALLGRVRRRIGDTRVLDLVKAFLKAGVLSEDNVERDTTAGTPQAASSPRCWPTSLSRSSTSISPRPGKHGAQTAVDIGYAAKESPSTASSATRTISSSWWRAPNPTPKPSGPTSRR